MAHLYREHPLARVSLDKLRRRIANARALDWSSLTDEQASHRVRLILDGFETMPIDLQTNAVFRARLNPSAEPFSRASELWYPPAQFVRRGRFNGPGQPMFYVANRFRSALWEMRPAPGDLFTVLVVRRRKIFENIACAHVGIDRCLADEVVKGGRHVLPRNQPGIRATLSDPKLSVRWRLIDAYLGDIATAECASGDEENKYKPTNALGETLLKIGGVDVLQYPSVALGMKALNLCMSPTKADQLFMPAEAWMVRIEDYAEHLPGAPSDERGFFKLRFVSRAKAPADDGVFDWRPCEGEPLPPYIFGDPLFQDVNRS